MGFYTHAIIATQNAARAGAAYASRNSSGGVNSAANRAAACRYALAELKTMSNVRGLSSCNSSPLVVTVSPVAGADGSPAASVAVTYQTKALIPIPGLAGKFNITRTVQMMVK